MVGRAWTLLAGVVFLRLDTGAFGSLLPDWIWSTPEREYKGMIDEIKVFYNEQLLPFEEKYRFHSFHSPPMKDADFDAKPLVMFVGQYSTGKTTAIRYLLGQDFPGMDVGKSPTTRKFMVVMSGDENTQVSGSVLMNDPNSQFRTLYKYGTAFSNMFQMSTTTSPVLKQVSFVDTPGILSGEKTRDYDNIEVLEWFAERADRIMLFFDADKLDISDEFKKTIEAFSGMEDKLRFVLNKSDMDHVELLRVYGSLMWNLGRVLKSPEVVKVYIGSLRDDKLQQEVFEPLIENEIQELLVDLQSVPKSSAMRKLGDMIKRTKKAKAHTLVLSKLKEALNSAGGTFGWWLLASRRAMMSDIIDNLQKDIYDPLMKEYFMSQEDFPELKRMQKLLASEDFEEFEVVDNKMLQELDKGIATVAKYQNTKEPDGNPDSISGGAFDGVGWIKSKSFYLNYENIGHEEFEKETLSLFQYLKVDDDAKLDGTRAWNEMLKSSLPKHLLQRIWKLSDVDGDSMLTREEYKVVLFLIRSMLAANDLPPALPTHFFPEHEARRLAKEKDNSKKEL